MLSLTTILPIVLTLLQTDWTWYYTQAQIMSIVSWVVFFVGLVLAVLIIVYILKKMKVI